MARINIKEMEKIRKHNSRVHEKVKATYSTFVYNREKYIQIDTYGSNGREFTEKVSQSFQIDEKSVKDLIELLNMELEN